eukprot:176592_1
MSKTNKKSNDLHERLLEPIDTDMNDLSTAFNEDEEEKELESDPNNINLKNNNSINGSLHSQNRIDSQSFTTSIRQTTTTKKQSEAISMGDGTQPTNTNVIDALRRKASQQTKTA